MGPSHFFTLPPQSCSAGGFVEFWKQQYQYQNGDLYEDNIQGAPMTEQRLRKLFEWKNGMNLSTKKEGSLNKKIISQLPVIQMLQVNFDQVMFNEAFKPLRPVWKIFLLHLINPNCFPIFDQHVYRAQLYLTTGKLLDKEKEPAITMDAYERYKPFYQTMVDCWTSVRRKDVDDALWAFGKFLSRYPRMIAP